MKYMLLMYWNQADQPTAPDTAAFQEAAKAWADVNKEAQEAGVLISTNGLSPVGNATTVRVRDGKTLITDGPFAETHEQLGGYYLVECKDIDEAVRWAAKIPAAKDGS